MVSRRYTYDFAPDARNDLQEIFDYISTELNNQEAAIDLFKCINNALENACLFPKSAPISTLVDAFELRKILVKNYLIFYQAEEDKQQITVYRIQYAKSDLSQLF